MKFTDKVPTQTWFLNRRTTSIHFAPQQIQEQNRTGNRTGRRVLAKPRLILDMTKCAVYTESSRLI